MSKKENKEPQVVSVSSEMKEVSHFLTSDGQMFKPEQVYDVKHYCKALGLTFETIYK